MLFCRGHELSNALYIQVLVSGKVSQFISLVEEGTSVEQSDGQPCVNWPPCGMEGGTCITKGLYNMLDQDFINGTHIAVSDRTTFRGRVELGRFATLGPRRRVLRMVISSPGGRFV